MSFFDGFFHAGRILRLHPYYMDIRIQHLCKCRHTGTKSATSYRYKYYIYCREFFDYLHCDTALSCSHCKVIERMNECRTALLCILHSLCSRFIKHISVEFYSCTVVFGSVYLYKRCCCRHKHCSLYSCQLCGVCHTLCMVSCRSRYNSLCLFFIGKC